LAEDKVGRNINYFLKEKFMPIRKGTLKNFNSTDYTATVQITGSLTVYLENVAVARNIPAEEMTAGRKVAMVFFDQHNAKEAVVIAVYT